MELLAADDEGVTLRISRLELSNIEALLHGVVVDFEKLDGQVHNLTKADVLEIDDAFGGLSGKAYDLRHGR